MVDDKEFLERYKKETLFLKNLQTKVNKAVTEADDVINRMENGESKEHIFGSVPSKQGQAAQGGKDHQ